MKNALQYARTTLDMVTAAAAALPVPAKVAAVAGTALAALVLARRAAADKADLGAAPGVPLAVAPLRGRRAAVVYRTAPSRARGGEPVTRGPAEPAALAARAAPQPAILDDSGKGVGGGRADRQADGTYQMYWQGELWMSSKNYGWQWIKWGRDTTYHVAATARNAAHARMWLDVMERGATAGPAVDVAYMAQQYVVYPPPPSKVGPFRCKSKPTTNLVSTVACGRAPAQRQDLRIKTYDAGNGWYVAVWRYGALAAGTDRGRVKALGWAAAVAVNNARRVMVETGRMPHE